VYVVLFFSAGSWHSSVYGEPIEGRPLAYFFSHFDMREELVPTQNVPVFNSTLPVPATSSSFPSPAEETRGCKIRCLYRARSAPRLEQLRCCPEIIHSAGQCAHPPLSSMSSAGSVYYGSPHPPFRASDRACLFARRGDGRVTMGWGFFRSSAGVACLCADTRAPCPPSQGLFKVFASPLLLRLSRLRGPKEGLFKFVYLPSSTQPTQVRF